MIDIICPKDGTLHNADKSDVGKTLRCRTCGATLTIGPQDEHPPIGIEQPRVKEKGDAGVTNGPLGDPTIGSARPLIALSGANVLVLAVLAAFVIMFLIVFWPSSPPPISSKKPPSGYNPAVVQTSPETLSGVPAPTSVKRTSNVKQVLAKPVLEENPPGALPPCAQGREQVRLKTGERIVPDGGTSGASNIRVMNADALDAAVKLVDSVTGKTSRFIYVQAGQTFAIQGIESGAYMLQFQYGRDWIPECHEFVRDSVYGEFAAPFVFLNDSIRYYDVTLSPVVGGRTITRKIGRKRFLGGQDTGVSP